MRPRTLVPRVGKFTLGEDDISEMLFLLSDNDFGVRPEKIRKICASAACRKSVMIGSDLKMGQMRKILDNMGTMDQPWNCPHGRPTIRHLVNLDLLEKNKSKKPL